MRSSEDIKTSSNHLRRATRAASATVLTLASIGMAVVTNPIVQAQAVSCNTAYIKESDGPNGALGYLAGTPGSCGYLQWYFESYNRNGNVSWLSQRGRAWVCGTLVHDFTLNQNGGRELSDSTPMYYYGGCGPQADLESGQGVNGQWSWWTYLNF